MLENPDPVGSVPSSTDEKQVTARACIHRAFICGGVEDSSAYVRLQIMQASLLVS